MVVAGVDIGGSHVTCVLLMAAPDGGSGGGGVEVQAKEVAAVTDRGVDAVVDVIVRGLLAVLAGVGPDDVLAIGVGVPGNVDPVRNVAKYLPNFAWPADVELGRLISKGLGVFQKVRIVMRNDGRCAALAETLLGAGHASRVFSMLTLGTGIGGALVIDKKLFDGATFDAGDFGHSVIRSDADAFECNCGKRGCFETQASAYGLVKQYRKQSASSSSGDAVTNAEQVLQLVHAGDAAALRALDVFLDDLSTGLANLVTFYNPDTIALGGGLAQASILFERLQTLVDEKTLPATKGKCRIVPASLGPDAGAIGAGVLALSSTQ